jgi:hypothetical protein
MPTGTQGNHEDLRISCLRAQAWTQHLQTKSYSFAWVRLRSFVSHFVWYSHRNLFLVQQRVIARTATCDSTYSNGWQYVRVPTTFCEVWGYYTSIAEYLSPLHCYIVCTDKYVGLPTFRRNYYHRTVCDRLQLDTSLYRPHWNEGDTVPSTSCFACNP